MGKRSEDESSSPDEHNSTDKSKRLKVEEDTTNKVASWKERNRGGLRFEVKGFPSSDFCTFVEKNSKEDVVRFFREITDEVEGKRGVLDFHFKIKDQKNWFFVEVFFGEVKEGPTAVAPGECIQCFAEAPLFPGNVSGIKAGECVLAEFSDQPHVQCSLDAKARSGFVITPVRHAERMSELQDEELFALWSTAVRALRQDSLPFRTMILNHGTYRTTPHLHLKVWVDDQLHQQLRLSWSSEKMDLWNRLLAIVEALPKLPCKFFQKNGRCGQGDACRFSHIKQS